VLSKLGSGRADTIKQKLDSYGITGNGKVELFADRQVGAFRTSNYYTVAIVGNYTIKEEILNGTVMPDFDKYVDLCFLWSKNLLLKGDIQGAINYFNKGMSYWSGTGFLDKPFNDTGKKEFETYKVGLALWMALQLNQTTNGQLHISDFSKMKNIIWSMQDSTNGGIHTGYTSNLGTADSDTNVETTAICLLYTPPETGAGGPPDYMIYIIVGMVGLATVVVFLVLKKTRRHSPRRVAPIERSFLSSQRKRSQSLKS